MSTAHIKAAEAHDAAALLWEQVSAGEIDERPAQSATRRAYAMSSQPDADPGGDFDDTRIARRDAKAEGPLAMAAWHRIEAEGHRQTNEDDVQD